MRIGLIVDGDAEFRALPHLYDRIGTPHILLSPVRAPIHPHAPFPQMAQAVARKIPILRSWDADAALVLLDRETRQECPGAIASSLLALIRPQCKASGIHHVSVVLKDRTFENWLISDPKALLRMPKRFGFASTSLRKFGGGADSVDAMSSLKTAAIGAAYSKTLDAPRILRLADPATMAKNSRSFEKFSRELGVVPVKARPRAKIGSRPPHRPPKKRKSP